MSTLSLPSSNIESYLNAQTYVPKGREEKLSDGTPIFVSGRSAGGNAVIIVPDESGWNVGRCRGLCDFFADHDYFSLIPNFSSKTSDSMSPRDWYQARTFEGKIKPAFDTILKYLKSRDVEKICLFGSGWGSWVVVRLLASEYTEHFQCGVLANPMIDLEEKIYGGSVPALFSRVNCPLMILSTEPDTAFYQAYTMMLQYKLPTTGIINYQDLESDFLLHGSLSNDRIRMALIKAFTEIDTYFSHHFQMSTADLVRELEDRFPIAELFSNDSAALEKSSRGNEGSGMNTLTAVDMTVSVAPYINVNAYQSRGNEIPIGDQRQPIAIYLTGSSTREEKWGLIIIPDTTGWTFGRLRNIADFFGEHNFVVAIPNLQLKGMDNQGVFMEKLSFLNDVVNPAIDAIIRYMKDKQGIAKIALLGFNWGSWVVTRLLASDLAEEFHCGALANPNIDYENKVQGGSVGELMARVQRPLLVIITAKEEESYRKLWELYHLDELPTSRVSKIDAADSNYLLAGKSGSYRTQIEKALNDIYSFFLTHFNRATNDFVFRGRANALKPEPKPSVERDSKKEEKSSQPVKPSAETSVAKIPLRRDSWENLKPDDRNVQPLFEPPQVKEQLLVVNDQETGEQLLFSEVQDYEPEKEGGTMTTTTTFLLQVPEELVAEKEEEEAPKQEPLKVKKKEVSKHEEITLDERAAQEERKQRKAREKKMTKEYSEVRMRVKEGVQHARELMKQVGDRLHSRVRSYRLEQVGL